MNSEGSERVATIDSSIGAPCHSTTLEQQEETEAEAREKFTENHPEYGFSNHTHHTYCSASNSTRTHSQAACPAQEQNGSSNSSGRSTDTSEQRRLVDSIREHDFPHLLQQHGSTRRGSLAIGSGRRGLVYLDHAGATLYSASQVREATEGLLGAVHGNPHSQVISSVFLQSGPYVLDSVPRSPGVW